jgi:putative phage-type endonuclease
MNPVPVLGWDAPRNLWLGFRRAGIGASDVAALLGLIPQWCTPWQLWAVKRGIMPEDELGEAAELGQLLEPWIIEQAPRLLGMDVQRTPHMLYRSELYPWRQVSPDAIAEDGSLVEAKTAKLASYGDPEGWEEGGVPLAYELQGRWQMHVMNRPRVHFVALVAGLGLLVRTIERHLPTEFSLIEQVIEWRERHIIGGIEPEVDAYDVTALAARYNTPKPESVLILTGSALADAIAYRDAVARESQAARDKKGPKARLQALLGNHEQGVFAGDGYPTVKWPAKRAEIDWEKMARDLAQQAGIELPDPEQWRKPSIRSFTVK